MKKTPFNKGISKQKYDDVIGVRIQIKKITSRNQFIKYGLQKKKPHADKHYICKEADE